MTDCPTTLPPFSAPMRGDDAIAARLMASRAHGGAGDADRRQDAADRAIRARDGGFGGVEDMLREFSLSTKVGLA